MSLSKEDRLRAFAQDILGNWPEIGDLDGFDIENLGVKHGLLKQVDPPPKKPCGERCQCAEAYDDEDFRDDLVVCYRKTPLLLGDVDWSRTDAADTEGGDL